MIRRREFIAGLGAAAWPAVAWAQKPERMRQIGVVMATDGTDADSEGRARLFGFMQGLSELGWTDGRVSTTPLDIAGLLPAAFP